MNVTMPGGRAGQEPDKGGCTILGFDMHTVQDIAHDMALDGLQAEPAEIFGIISEFIEQDSEKE